MKSKYKTYQKIAVDAVPAKGVQVFVVPLTDPKDGVAAAKSGDVVEVESSLEVTPRTLWSRWRSYMGAQGGTNITPSQHHCTFERSGHVTIPPTSTTRPWYWIYVIWCACLASATPSRRGNRGPRRRRRLSVDSPPRGEVRSTFPLRAMAKIKFAPARAGAFSCARPAAKK
jgi:hypothetical protein